MRASGAKSDYSSVTMAKDSPSGLRGDHTKDISDPEDPTDANEGMGDKNYQRLLGGSRGKRKKIYY